MFKKLIGFFLTTLIIGGAVAAMLNAQLIRDTVAYYQYDPNETIASFAQQTGMNDKGKFLFYVSHPSLEAAEDFNVLCDKTEHTAAVLGCYDGQRIYIYDITDPRLSGIRPTTAAHEMLHAAYVRLGDNERQSVDSMLEAEYDTLKDDKELVERMALYAKTQLGDRTNELHSILGTEVEILSPELEQYYKRYFSDRGKVIGQHKQYQVLFEELRARAEQLNRQIDSLAEAINTKKASYEAQINALQNDIKAFNSRANSGGFTSQAEFNVQRQTLIAQSSALNDLRIEINNDINYYNSLVRELDSIAIETNALNRSLDSSLEPAPSL